MSKIAIVITQIRGLVTPIKATHEPPSTTPSESGFFKVWDFCCGLRLFLGFR